VGDWVGSPGRLEEDRDTTILEVFSTITSPVFSELVVVLAREHSSYLHRQVAAFETLRKVNRVRPFKLVFLLEVLDPFQRDARRELAEALESVTAKGLLDFLDSPPAIRFG